VVEEGSKKNFDQNKFGGRGKLDCSEEGVKSVNGA